MGLNRYILEVKVKFKDVDATKQMTMNALVDYMQEASNQHAGVLGIDFSKDPDGELYWIVSRAKIHIDRYPVLEEQIKLITYPVGVDRLFAVRHFEMIDEKGEKIGYMIGDYVLMNSRTKRPVRLKDLQGPLKCFDQPYSGEVLEKLGAPTIIQKQDQRKVRYGEIDFNNHMNNAYYVRWAMDMFTCEELEKYTVESIQTNYITSLTEGIEARIVRGLDAEGNIIIQGTSLDEDIIYWTNKIVAIVG